MINMHDLLTHLSFFLRSPLDNYSAKLQGVAEGSAGPRHQDIILRFMTANLTEMRSSKLIFLHRGFRCWESVYTAHLSTRHPFSSQTMLSSVTNVEVAVVVAVVVVVVVVTLSQFPKLQIMSL